MKNLIIVIIAALLTAACSGPAKTASGKKLRIAVVTNNSSDWWAIARRGGDDAARELGDVDFDFRMVSEGTAAAQKALVDDLLVRGVDGLMVSPIDVENQKQMIDDAASKTLVFTLGADAPATRRAAYVGSDDVAAGKMAGEMIRKALPRGGRIVVFVGRRDAQNAIDRLEGLKQGVAGGGIEILDVRTDDSDTAKAKANAADALVKYPDIDGLVGLWSYNTPAILSALRDAGKTGKVTVVGFDEDEQTLAGVRDGAVFATVVQQPYGFTKDAVRRMALALRGDRSQIPADGRAIFPTEVVDRSNVDGFAREMNRLRGK
ncbi:MAG: substrate-binding domain-containing protein [Acidobacteria bacterium]|nr:substrate-binding domain-containing protein [Acidobacteriota bacterium]